MDTSLGVFPTLVWAPLIITVFFQLILWRVGFYTIPPSDAALPEVSLLRVIQGFSILFAIQFVVIPGVLFAWFSFKSGQWAAEKGFDLTTDQELWFGTWGIYITSMAILLFALFAGFARWGGRRQLPGILAVAALGCLSSLTLVFWINQILDLLMNYLGPFHHVDQLAVRHLKAAQASPEIFWLTVIGIVTFVPIAEEILFRGLLQSYVIKKIGRFAGIVFTALAFASFHFSLSQGWDNVQLMISLTIVGIFMGYVYERERALLAPILLHSLFNALNVMFLLNGGPPQ